MNALTYSIDGLKRMPSLALGKLVLPEQRQQVILVSVKDGIVMSTPAATELVSGEELKQQQLEAARNLIDSVAREAIGGELVDYEKVLEGRIARRKPYVERLSFFGRGNTEAILSAAIESAKEVVNEDVEVEDPVEAVRAKIRERLGVDATDDKVASQQVHDLRVLRGLKAFRSFVEEHRGT